MLRAYHIFGRSQTKTDTLISGKDISHIHASIRWQHSQWCVVDHSKNGTWIGDTRLVSGQDSVLNLGDVIRFANSPVECWSVMDLDEPKAMLIPQNEDCDAIELNKILVLPNDENPQLTIYQREAHQWIYENNNDVRNLNDGDLVSYENKQWSFSAPRPIDATIDYSTSTKQQLNHIHVYFEVSLDEEHVFVNIAHEGKMYKLGERVHHYLLLILARLRIKDAEDGLDVNNQGWVDIDRLEKMLGLDASHINIQIFRARKQIIQSLPEMLYLPQIVERRVGSVRFGYTRIQIMRGNSIESSNVSGAVLAR